MDYTAHFQKIVQGIREEGRYRQFKQVDRSHEGSSCHGKVCWKGEEIECTIWCNNDYLGMGKQKKIIDAVQSELLRTGAGSGGTRNIAGTHSAMVELEMLLAHWHRKERALVYSSAFLANEYTLSTLGKLLPTAVIFSDEKNHASLIQGVRYSGCRKEIFRHNDLAHLEELLAKEPLETPKIIVFESVYSMDGDISPIEEIIALAQKYNALTYLDEVHAVGLYGETGAGVAAQRGVSDQIDLINGTLGKAIGVVGGYVAGPDELLDAVRLSAPGFIFTTSLPPYIAKGAVASIELLEHDVSFRERLWRNVEATKQALRAIGAPMIEGESQIVPVVIGDPHLCQEIADRFLVEHKIYVQAINYPTVPRGTERLRIVPSASHSQADIDKMVHALANLLEEYNLLPLCKEK